MNELGRIAAIWRYPVKSLAAQALSSVRVEQDGIPGDRSRALIVEDGHARLGKTYRGKENNLLHMTESTEDAVARAAQRQVHVRVANEAPHYFDAAPISVIFDRWLMEASALVGYELEPLRFRPNFFVTASDSFSGVERDFAGSMLHAGGLRLRVRGPIERCVTTTYDLRTGVWDPGVLRAVAQHRETFLGLYCDVEEAGTVTLGDAVSGTAALA